MLANILLRIFALLFISVIGLYIFVVAVVSVSCFGVRLMLALQNEFRNFPLLQFFEVI